MDSVQEALLKWPSAWDRWLWASLVFAATGVAARRHTATSHGSGRKRRASGARSEAQPSEGYQAGPGATPSGTGAPANTRMRSRKRQRSVSRTSRSW